MRTTSATVAMVIEETTAARDALHREMVDTLARRAAAGLKAPKGWLTRKANTMARYNELLVNLGAIPA